MKLEHKIHIWILERLWVLAGRIECKGFKWKEACQRKLYRIDPERRVIRGSQPRN